MEKVALSIVLSLTLATGAAGGFFLSRRSEAGRSSSERMAEELSAVREEIQSAQEETRTLMAEFRRLASIPTAPAAEPGATRAAAPGTDESAPPLSAWMVLPEDLKIQVVAALEEDRKQRDVERRREREESQEKSEARRKEIASMREGPYERFNLKVNSLAKALALNDAQKQAYFEVSKQTLDRFQEGRKKLADETGALGKAPEGKRGRERGDRGQSRELLEGPQKEFTQAVEGLLSPSQLEVYAQLSESARSFQRTETLVVPASERGASGKSSGDWAAGSRGRSQGGPRREPSSGQPKAR